MTTEQTSLATVPGRFDHATWRPVPVNFSRGANQPRLLIVHIMQGSLEGTDGWFRNPASEVSSHFGLARDGRLWQWVNCDDMAWHAVLANPRSIGVECEGYSGNALTTRQLEQLGRIYAWAMDRYPAISAWLNTRPDTGSGLSWHGLGGADWGGHPDCPGLPAVHQLADILRTAGQLAAGAAG